MIIGLIGKARSGKTTIAKYLMEKHDFVEVSFSKNLKEMIISTLLKNPPPGISISEKELRDEFYVNRTPHSRWFLQYIGTDIVRAVDPDYWVKSAPLTHFADVVVSDVRFANECKAVKDRGGIIIRVVRDSGGSIEHGADHASETELDNYAADKTICGRDGDIADLLHQVDEYLKEIKR